MSTTSDSEWFADPTTVLEELRRGGRRISAAPLVEGYDDLVELRRVVRLEVCKRCAKKQRFVL